MATDLPPGTHEFLQRQPTPATTVQAAAENPADRLPAAIVEQLMKMPGIDGVWVERAARGGRVVVLHYRPKGSTAHLPSVVHGLPTRIVGGEPIRAGS